MEELDPIDALSPTYADGLRLRDEGLEHAEIAAKLGLEPDGVAAFLRLAQAKLDREIRGDAGGGCEA